MSNRYLIAMGFDETLFHTFVPSPNGMSVRKAYDLAVRDIFGQEVEDFFQAMVDYNKTPSELIEDLLHSFNGNEEEKAFFLKRARQFFNSGEGYSGYLVPECADGKLIWNDNNLPRTLTLMLIQRKLAYLVDEIGQRDKDGQMWPQPCKDALPFLSAAEKLRQHGIPLDLAIISSGHEAFIRKVFQVWETPCPSILVTEDDIRTRKYPKEFQRRFKPGQFPLALAHYKWLKEQSFTTDTDSLVRKGADTKPNIMYIGDSLTKDLFMADRGKVLCYLYPYTPWSAITECLLTRHNLLDGRPISEVFSEDRLLPDSIARLKGGPERS